MHTSMKLIIALVIGVYAGTSSAAVMTFDFTGRLMVASSSGGVLTNDGNTYTPIAASLTYDTASGIGASGLSITMSDPFLNAPATLHDISMTRISGTDLISGQIYADWNGTTNMPIDIQWDGTGLFTAINHGLAVGDVLSGNTLYHDSNGNGRQDSGEFIMNINSATPYSNSLDDAYYAALGMANPDPQGPAPMAATADSLGLTSGPFIGLFVYMDIGSGNSMHVTSVSAVPSPATAWLLASGLLALAGLSRRKRV